MAGRLRWGRVKFRNENKKKVFWQGGSQLFDTFLSDLKKAKGGKGGRSRTSKELGEVECDCNFSSLNQRDLRQVCEQGGYELTEMLRRTARGREKTRKSFWQNDCADLDDRTRPKDKQLVGSRVMLPQK